MGRQITAPAVLPCYDVAEFRKVALKRFALHFIALFIETDTRQTVPIIRTENIYVRYCSLKFLDRYLLKFR